MIPPTSPCRQKAGDGVPADAKAPQQGEEKQSPSNEQGQPPAGNEPHPVPVTPQIDDPKAVHINGEH